MGYFEVFAYAITWLSDPSWHNGPGAELLPSSEENGFVLAENTDFFVFIFLGTPVDHHTKLLYAAYLSILCVQLSA